MRLRWRPLVGRSCFAVQGLVQRQKAWPDLEASVLLADVQGSRSACWRWPSLGFAGSTIQGFVTKGPSKSW